MYYTTRSLLPEIFENRDPFSSAVQTVLNKGVVIPFPISSKDSASPRVIVLRWEVCDSESITVYDIARVYFMVLDILMYEDDNIMISGQQLISDFTGFSFNYVLQLTPPFLKKIITLMQNTYPIRMKGLYCTNAPGFFETVFNIIKSLMSEKLKNRTFMYSENNSGNLHEHISQAIFPEEYGGNNGTIEKLAAEWKKKIESYRDWLLDDRKYSVQEKLRIGKPHTSAEIFGVEGSFRKLAID